MVHKGGGLQSSKERGSWSILLFNLETPLKAQKNQPKHTTRETRTYRDCIHTHHHQGQKASNLGAEIAESTEIAESAEITERTED
ncbi:hypothetical protein Tco_0725087, partial [Tanacetum coccineum]